MCWKLFLYMLWLQTCLSNGVPSIVLRGVSDLAGGRESLLTLSMSSLAFVNALSTAVEFIALVDERNTVHYQTTVTLPMH